MKTIFSDVVIKILEFVARLPEFVGVGTILVKAEMIWSHIWTIEKIEESVV